MSKNKQQKKQPARQNQSEPKPRRFEPKDLLCAAAAVIFIGIWLASQYQVELSPALTAAAYAAIILLIAIYFLNSEKFRGAWRRWGKHTKIYFLILILGDVIACLTYDIIGNLTHLLLLIAVNFIYYLLFLHNQTK